MKTVSELLAAWPRVTSCPRVFYRFVFFFYFFFAAVGMCFLFGGHVVQVEQHRNPARFNVRSPSLFRGVGSLTLTFFLIPISNQSLVLCGALGL